MNSHKREKQVILLLPSLSNMALPTHKFCSKTFPVFLESLKEEIYLFIFQLFLFWEGIPSHIVILMIIIICMSSEFLDGKEDIIMSNWTINCASKRQVLWCFRWDDIYYIDDTLEREKSERQQHTFSKVYMYMYICMLQCVGVCWGTHLKSNF